MATIVSIDKVIRNLVTGEFKEDYVAFDRDCIDTDGCPAIVLTFLRLAS